jgi:hypothetical protein
VQLSIPNENNNRASEYLLHKAIALGTPTILWLLLQCYLLQLAERTEDGGQIGFRHTEMDVADIQAMERGTISYRSVRLGCAGGAVLLSFSQLDNDGYTLEPLSGLLESLGNRLDVFELDISDTVIVSQRPRYFQMKSLPL